MSTLNFEMLITKTGFVGWPLLACSVLGAAIIIERSIYFLRIRMDYKIFSRKLYILLNNKQMMQAVHYCQERHHPVAKIAGVYLRNLHSQRRESQLSREATFLMEGVETRLRGLATITHVAPVLGLLGTVTGLVTAFQKLNLVDGQVDPQLLAGGIWEALLSTVFGLVVAIPCMVAHHGFESRADWIDRRIKSIIHELDVFFANQSHEERQAAVSKEGNG